VKHVLLLFFTKKPKFPLDFPAPTSCTLELLHHHNHQSPSCWRIMQEQIKS